MFDFYHLYRDDKVVCYCLDDDRNEYVHPESEGREDDSESEDDGEEGNENGRKERWKLYRFYQEGPGGLVELKVLMDGVYLHREGKLEFSDPNDAPFIENSYARIKFVNVEFSFPDVDDAIEAWLDSSLLKSAALQRKAYMAYRKTCLAVQGEWLLPGVPYEEEDAVRRATQYILSVQEEKEGIEDGDVSPSDVCSQFFWVHAQRFSSILCRTI